MLLRGLGGKVHDRTVTKPSRRDARLGTVHFSPVMAARAGLASTRRPRLAGQGDPMAELVTVGDHQYLKRSPIGVMGLALVTLGIYFFVWYYKINDEIRTFEQDDTISPTGR
jgi:hypothetical protein